MKANFLQSAHRQFGYYRMLGEKAIEQVADDKLFWQYNDESNSIATIVKHLHGNMMSRWTDFLTSDGEKEWRKRDSEFENDLDTRAKVLQLWNEGWTCLFAALDTLTEADLNKTIYIRNQGHSAMEAINRQLAHYPYHIGQIVYISKMLQNEKWISLSIPRGKSDDFNKEKFSQEKHNEHFTEEFLKQKPKNP